MKNRVKYLHTGDLVLTNDVEINIGGNTTWQLFVILGQHIIESRNSMMCFGTMLYEVAPAHIDGDAIVFDILQKGITIDDTDIKLVVGKTDRFSDPDSYDESLAEVVKDVEYRKQIKRLEDREIIMSLARVLDDLVELKGDSSLKKCLFNIIYRRDMDPQTAADCLNHILESGNRDTICNHYRIDWTTYMSTMKHLKEIIKSAEKQ